MYDFRLLENRVVSHSGAFLVDIGFAVGGWDGLCPEQAGYAADIFACAFTCKG
jgi:hypothetical protein